MSFNGPVFVVGCARSGTKLIRDLMNRHPRIRIPKSETELLPYLASIIDSFGDLSQPMAFSHLCDWAMDSLYFRSCLLYTSPSPRDATLSRMPSSA